MCVCVVEVDIGSAGGAAIAGSAAGVVEVEFVVVPPGVCTVVELAAGAVGSEVVLVVVVVCATAISGSAHRAMARVAIRMETSFFLLAPQQARPGIMLKSSE